MVRHIISKAEVVKFRSRSQSKNEIIIVLRTLLILSIGFACGFEDGKPVLSWVIHTFFWAKARKVYYNITEVDAVIDQKKF